MSVNFNNEFFASGSNDMSIDNYFLNYAQGLRLDEISAFDGESYTDAYGDIGAIYGYNNQQAFLGYESYILEPDSYDNDNTNYSSNIAPGNFYHEYSYITTGNNNKLSFNAAMKYQDDFYFGLNLNTHFVDYNLLNLKIITDIWVLVKFRYQKVENIIKSDSNFEVREFFSITLDDSCLEAKVFMNVGHLLSSH